MIGNLSHVAIAVPDLTTAIIQYEKVFGMFVTSPQDLPHHGVRVAIVKLLNTTLELITPLGDSSPLESFLKKNPQGGIHHLCYEVPNITKARDILTSAGLRVIGNGIPTLGYHGRPVLFLHPKDCLGALIELEEVVLSKSDEIPTNSSLHLSKPSSALLTGSLEGVPGIGLEIEVDFKSKTPEDNREGA